MRARGPEALPLLRRRLASLASETGRAGRSQHRRVGGQLATRTDGPGFGRVWIWISPGMEDRVDAIRKVVRGICSCMASDLELGEFSLEIRRMAPGEHPGVMVRVGPVPAPGKVVRMLCQVAENPQLPERARPGREKRPHKGDLIVFLTGPRSAPPTKENLPEPEEGLWGKAVWVDLDAEVFHIGRIPNEEDGCGTTVHGEEEND